MPITVPQFTGTPSMSRPATFDVEADRTVSEWPAIIAAQNAQNAENNVLAAATAADAATATAAKNTAVATVNATAWVSGTNYVIGDTRWSPINLLTYRRKTNGAGATDPSADPENWAFVSIIKQYYSARAANTILGTDDDRWLIDTTGTWTQTLTAAATLGAGWSCIIRNSGTGVVTLDPIGAETIDGLTALVMYSGESRLVLCTGTGFTTIILAPFSLATSTSFNWVPPPGYAAFDVIAIGGGGGGGGGAATYNMSGSYGGSGGCGGATVIDQIGADVCGATETITVGAGGTGAVAATYVAGGTGSTIGAGGGTGGNTTVGSILMAQGGHCGAGGTWTDTGYAEVGVSASFPNDVYRNATIGGGSSVGMPGGSTQGYGATGGGAGGAEIGGFKYNGAAGGSRGNATYVNGPRLVAAGGTGGIAASTTAAGVGVSFAATSGVCGTGGGGGYGQRAAGATANSGGAGGFPGAGGGGGGGAQSTTNAVTVTGGAGGAGGAGVIIIRGIA